MASALYEANCEVVIDCHVASLTTSGVYPFAETSAASALLVPPLTLLPRMRTSEATACAGCVWPARLMTEPPRSGPVSLLKFLKPHRLG